MKKPESILQKKIKEYLKSEFGGVWHKIHGDMFQDAGIGDLVGCLYGYYFNLEVKCPNNKKRKKNQTEEIQKVNLQGGCGAYVTSIEEADQVVRTYLEDKAIYLPKKSSKASDTWGTIRSVDGTRHRKNTSRIKSGCILLEE